MFGSIYFIVVLKECVIGQAYKITQIGVPKETKEKLFRLDVFSGQEITLLKVFRFGGIIVKCGESVITLSKDFLTFIGVCNV